MKRLVRENLLEITPYQPGKPIEELQRELNVKDVIKLASNENPLGPSPRAVSFMKKALGNLNRYPDANCYYLKQKLSKKFGVTDSNLIIGNGSDEIIVLSTKAFLEPQDEVIIADPTFLIYKIATKIADARIKFVPLKNFKYDLVSMKMAITDKTKLVFVANPDNPTGTYATRTEVDEFMNGLPEDLIVFFDEAYFEFGTSMRDYPDTLKYLNKKNIIITRSFSKAYGLSGIRVGYGIANPELIEYMNRAREPFNVNSLAQIGAIAALDDEVFLKRTLQITREGKEFMYKAFSQMGLSYVPSATNFILVDIKKDSSKIFYDMLKEGVIIRDMKAWQLDTFIRVTVGTMKENKRFVKALKKVLT